MNTMRLLDRYIIKQFVQNYLILWAVLGGLFLLVDLIVDLDEFLRAGKENADRFGSALLGTAWSMADYYGPTFLLLFTVVSGLLVVAAMGFTVAQLQRSREVTAILASGVSLYRVAAPVLIAGFAINLLVLPVQELAIPPLAEKLVRSKSQVGRPTLNDKPVNYARDEAGSLISAASFSVSQRELTDVRIIERDEEGRQTRLIRAERAAWSGQDKAWLLEGGRAFDTRVEADAAEVLQGVPALRYATELSPDVLITRQAAVYIRLQSLRKLEAMSGNEALTPEQRGRITQVMWSRITTLILGVLVLLMGLPFFLTRVPGNILINSAKAAAVTVGAWSGGLVLVQVGGLNPVTAAWLPVILFGPVACYLVTAIKT